MEEKTITNQEYYGSGKLKSEKNIDYKYHKNGKVEITIEKLENGGIIIYRYSELGKLISTREEKENNIVEKEFYRSGDLKSEKNYSRVKENDGNLMKMIDKI